MFFKRQIGGNVLYLFNWMRKQGCPPMWLYKNKVNCPLPPDTRLFVGCTRVTVIFPTACLPFSLHCWSVWFQCILTGLKGDSQNCLSIFGRTKCCPFSQREGSDLELNQIPALGLQTNYSGPCYTLYYELHKF